MSYHGGDNEYEDSLLDLHPREQAKVAADKYRAGYADARHGLPPSDWSSRSYMAGYRDGRDGKK